jgi:hypothetical protein
MGLVTEITYMSHVLHIYIYVNWMDLPVDLPEANRANLLASWSGNPHNLEDLNLWQPLRWNLSYLQALILVKAGNLHLRFYHLQHDAKLTMATAAVRCRSTWKPTYTWHKTITYYECMLTE